MVAYRFRELGEEPRRRELAIGDGERYRDRQDNVVFNFFKEGERERKEEKID